MAKALTAQDIIRAAFAKAEAGNGRALASLVANARPGDLAEGFALYPNQLDMVLTFSSVKEAERERIRAEKREAQRAARAANEAKLDAEYGART